MPPSGGLNRNIIVPHQSEKDEIVKHYYVKTKGDGARKLVVCISKSYGGISREYIRKWTNKNEKHFQTNPIFTNKPAPSPPPKKKNSHLTSRHVTEPNKLSGFRKVSGFEEQINVQVCLVSHGRLLDISLSETTVQ